MNTKTKNILAIALASMVLVVGVSAVVLSNNPNTKTTTQTGNNTDNSADKSNDQDSDVASPTSTPTPSASATPTPTPTASATPVVTPTPVPTQGYVATNESARLFLRAVSNQNISYSNGVRRYLSDNYLASSRLGSRTLDNILKSSSYYDTYKNIQISNISVSSPSPANNCQKLVTTPDLCKGVVDTVHQSFTVEASFDQDIMYNFKVLENNSTRGGWYRTERITLQFVMGAVESLGRYEIMDIKTLSKFDKFWNVNPNAFTPELDPYQQQLIMQCVRQDLDSNDIGLNCDGVEYEYLLSKCTIDPALKDEYPSDIVCTA